MPENLLRSLDRAIDATVKEVGSKPFIDESHFLGAPQELMDQVFKESKLARDAFLKGYQLVLNYAGQGRFSEPQKSFHINTDGKKIEKEQLLESLKEHTFQELFSYTPKMMREIYDLGHSFYTDREFDKSIDIFTFLILLNPTVSYFWKLLGRSYEGKRDFAHASYAFNCAINCNLRSLTGYQDAVRCYIEHKDFENALQILDFGLSVVKLDNNSASSKELKKGLEAMKLYVTRLSGA